MAQANQQQMLLQQVQADLIQQTKVSVCPFTLFMQ